MEYWRDELYHHGIKGQRWGIRRFQNSDGTLTPRGVKHYRKKERDSNLYNQFAKDYVDSANAVDKSKDVLAAQKTIAKNKNGKFDSWKSSSDLLSPKIEKEVKKIMGASFYEPVERIAYRDNEKGRSSAYLKTTTRGRDVVDAILEYKIETAWDMDLD